MSEVWFISDTHFGHKKVLTFVDYEDKLLRPEFEDINHMNETLISNWNSVIKPNDKVYHLGDFAFGRRTIDEIAPRLNGRKVLILGNHDLHIDLLSKYFKIKLCHKFKTENTPFVLSHMPIHANALTGCPALANVHGHNHRPNNYEGSQYINITVEATNYMPVNWNFILSKVKKYYEYFPSLQFSLSSLVEEELYGFR